MPTAATDGQPLTARQEQVFRFLATYFAGHQRMPSFREMCTGMGFTTSPNGILPHLMALVRKGYLKHERHVRGTPGGAKSRAFEIVGLSERLAPVVEAHVTALLAEGHASE